MRASLAAAAEKRKKEGFPMVGFEILLNGKRLYIAGIGDFGVMGAGAEYHRVPTPGGPIGERVLFECGGHSCDASGRKQLQAWESVVAQIGDEITIRIIETDACDPPFQSADSHPTDSNQHRPE